MSPRHLSVQSRVWREDSASTGRRCMKCRCHGQSKPSTTQASDNTAPKSRAVFRLSSAITVEIIAAVSSLALSDSSNSLLLNLGRPNCCLPGSSCSSYVAQSLLLKSLERDSVSHVHCGHYWKALSHRLSQPPTGRQTKHTNAHFSPHGHLGLLPRSRLHRGATFKHHGSCRPLSIPGEAIPIVDTD